MKTIILLSTFACICAYSAAAGPFAPPVGIEGTSAISSTSPDIIAWADGWQEYLPGSHVDLIWQTPEKALGPAQPPGSNNVYEIVSLGRGGSIVLTFEDGISDGEGWDFAVFENAHNDVFLELAYVEVSSDGFNFKRFPNTSLTSAPVGAFGMVNATLVDGLAGKYRIGYGTPFDLSVFAALSSLDINNIRYIRIVDVVGDGTALDSHGNAIYDPYPTVGSAGFDLSGIAVRYQARTAPIRLNPFADVPTFQDSGLKFVFLNWIDDSEYPWVYYFYHGWRWHADDLIDQGIWVYEHDSNLQWLYLLQDNAWFYSLVHEAWLWPWIDPVTGERYLYTSPGVLLNE